MIDQLLLLYFLRRYFLEEFQRLTDRIDILTKARDNLTEYMREVQDRRTNELVSCSSPNTDQSLSLHSPTYSSPIDKFSYQQRFALPSVPLHTKDILVHDYPTMNDQRIHQHSYSPLSSNSTHQTHYYSSRSRSPSMTTGNFIRVHFPNKHTTAV
jgi:hypothetical protein